MVRYQAPEQVYNDDQILGKYSIRVRVRVRVRVGVRFRFRVMVRVQLLTKQPHELRIIIN